MGHNEQRATRKSHHRAGEQCSRRPTPCISTAVITIQRGRSPRGVRATRGQPSPRRRGAVTFSIKSPYWAHLRPERERAHAAQKESFDAIGPFLHFSTHFPFSFLSSPEETPCFGPSSRNKRFSSERKKKRKPNDALALPREVSEVMASYCIHKDLFSSLHVWLYSIHVYT